MSSLNGSGQSSGIAGLVLVHNHEEDLTYCKTLEQT